MDTDKTKLFLKMAQVMGKVRTLEKTGRNQFDKYDYVTADAIATRLGTAMAEAKLALLPSIVDVKTEDYATKSGGNNFRTVVHMQMTIACGETGASWTSDWFGEAIDRSDKSISKAAVSAVKYFLLKTFLLAGGEEEDADAQSPVVEARQPAQKAAEPRNGTPPAQRNMTDPDAPQRAPVQATGDVAASAKQLEHLDTIGYQYYGDKWPDNQMKWAMWASGNKHPKLETLMPEQADAVIEGIEKRMAAAVAQPQPEAA
jgi:hypothetical protein